MNGPMFLGTIREEYSSVPKILLAMLAVAVGLICLLIGMSVTTVIAETIVVGGWLLWERFVWNDGRFPLLGGMISCWRVISWPLGTDDVWYAILNLLFYYRLAFLLPLAYLHWW